jgi:GNAT superfamily N-acetyltransferase
MSPIELQYDGSRVSGEAFVALAQRIWPRNYDIGRTQEALAKTTNIGAWDGSRLIGVIRVLSDGYLFATVPEVLVDPEYQRRGVGRELMRRALDVAPRGKLFFGAQQQSVGFFTKLGCRLGPVGFVAERTDAAGPAQRTT